MTAKEYVCNQMYKQHALLRKDSWTDADKLEYMELDVAPYSRYWRMGMKKALKHAIKLLREEEAKADRKTENSSEKPNNSTISILEQVEPQTELVNDSPILAKDLVNDEFNPYDEECMRCKHLKLQCEFVPSYCKYEPRDETQTEEPPMDEYYKDHDEFYEPQERSRE